MVELRPEPQRLETIAFPMDPAVYEPVDRLSRNRRNPVFELDFQELGSSDVTSMALSPPRILWVVDALSQLQGLDNITSRMVCDKMPVLDRYGTDILRPVQRYLRILIERDFPIVPMGSRMDRRYTMGQMAVLQMRHVETEEMRKNFEHKRRYPTRLQGRRKR